MNNEFFDALEMLEQEKGIQADYLIEKIKNAIVIAVKRDYQVTDNINVVIDPETRKFSVSIVKNVVARHGGVCRAENTADGVAFSFFLPFGG